MIDKVKRTGKGPRVCLQCAEAIRYALMAPLRWMAIAAFGFALAACARPAPPAPTNGFSEAYERSATRLAVARSSTGRYVAVARDRSGVLPTFEGGQVSAGATAANPFAILLAPFALLAEALSAVVPTPIGANRAVGASREVDRGLETVFAAFGVVAFPDRPTQSEAERAAHICEGFISSLAPSERHLFELGVPLRNQIVTVWPVKTPVLSRDDDCGEFVVFYDELEGRSAIGDARAFFDARGKEPIVRRLDTSRGPWLLAWAPGALKDDTSDRVLLMAFDLSFVDSAEDARRVFRAWRTAVESNEDLWREAAISNDTWHSAIIAWANTVGRDIDFYERLVQ